MADRVHPVAGDDDDNAPAPSAPPLRGGSAADYDAEKAIRKEQEQALMAAASRGEEEELEEGHGHGHGDGGSSSSVGSSPAGKPSSSSAQPSPSPSQAAKDIIYRMPPPLPADHPSNKAKVKEDRRRRRRRNGRCCCCCVIWTAAAAMAMALLLGAAAGIAWLVLQPKAPAFEVKEASVAKLEAAEASSASAGGGSAAAMAIDSSVNLTLQATNPNAKIGIYYDAIAVSLLYQGQGIGNGSVPAFYQGHGDVRVLQVELRGQGVAVSEQLASSLNATLSDPSQDLSLASQAQIQARIKVGSWTSGPSRVDVACSFTISNPRSSSSTVSLLSKSCSFKLRSFRIFSSSF